MNVASKEKHFSVFESDHKRLSKLAKKENRTMRALFKIMLDEREKATHGTK